MTSPIDLDTVRSTFAAQRRRRESSRAPLSVWPTSSGPEGVIEVLWSQREVQDFGAVSRIEVPLAGDLSALPSCRALAVELERRWVHRRSLGAGLSPISVSVELVRTIGGARLVLLVAAPGIAVRHSPMAMAMARDLRAAIRRCGPQPLRTTPQMRVVLGADDE